jgi:AraC-like DNA-binding protein
VAEGAPCEKALDWRWDARQAALAGRKVRISVPREVESRNQGGSIGPIAVFQSTMLLEKEHAEPGSFLFFIPLSGIRYVFSSDGIRHDLSCVRAPHVICKMPGMPSRGDGTVVDASFFMVAVDPGYAYEIAGEVFDIHPISIGPRLYPIAEELLRDIRRAYDTVSAQDAESRLTAECLTPLVIAGLIKACMPGIEAGAQRVGSHPGLRKAIRLMKEEFRSNASIDVFASEAGLCKSRFIELFKRQMDITPHEYIRSLRVREARRVLERGGGITEVSFEVGFDSLSGFEACFKKFTGMSPSRYRAGL